MKYYFFNNLNLHRKKEAKLNQLVLGNAEVLTREQLKRVLGGDGGSSGQCNFQINCIYDPTCGQHQGSPGTCSGDPINGDCFPVEQQCYEDANAACANDPCCEGCVPY